MNKKAVCLIALAVCTASTTILPGCSKSEKISSNANIADSSDENKKINEVQLKLGEKWKKLSRDGDTVTYLYNGEKGEINLQIYVPKDLPGSPAEKNEYLLYKMHEDNPSCTQADITNISGKYWQTYRKQELVADIKTNFEYYTYTTDQGCVLLRFTYPAVVNFEEEIKSVLENVSTDGSEKDFKPEKDENLWVTTSPLLLSSKWEKTDTGYKNGKRNLSFEKSNDVSELTIKQKTGTPFMETTIYVGDYQFTEMLYLAKYNTVIKQDILYFISADGTLIKFEGTNLENYKRIAEMIVETYQENENANSTETAAASADNIPADNTTETAATATENTVPSSDTPTVTPSTEQQTPEYTPAIDPETGEEIEEGAVLSE